MANQRKTRVVATRDVSQINRRELFEIERRIAVGNQQIARQRAFMAMLAQNGLVSLSAHCVLVALEQLQEFYKQYRDALHLENVPGHDPSKAMGPLIARTPPNQVDQINSRTGINS